jgi:hypothetical protein
MTFDFSEKGKVMVNMIEYIKTIIKDFPEEIITTRASPTADHLFAVRDETEATPLPEEQACAFHYATAPVLFLSARARCDIQPCTAFLTTRVKYPDKDDWGKRKRLLGYLKGTLHMPLILSADSLTLSHWWVDTAYAVHHDMKRHMGVGMSFGQGMALSYSWKQEIMTKISTEAELVVVDDSLGYILWAQYFMQEQGYDMEASLLYQDNMSAMLLETNGKGNQGKFFLLRIKSTRVTSWSNIVRLRRCGQTSIRNQSRGRSFVSLGYILWASQRNTTMPISMSAMCP